LHLRDTIVITGASSGIGWALVSALAGREVNIAALARRPELISELWNNIPAAERKASILSIGCDVGKAEEVQAAFNQIKEKFGPVKILINNAGITHISLFKKGHSEATKNLFDTNFFGAVYCAEEALDDLIQTKGHLVNVSSVAGYAPLAGRTAYAASKHAMHGFFETLRTELRLSGVHVMMVCPTFVATGIRNPGEKKLEVETLQADDVAKAILLGIERKERLLLLGKTAKLAYYFNKFFPRFYESMMLKKQQQIFIDNSK
jgi:short-subunit dehydrogenase